MKDVGSNGHSSDENCGIFGATLLKQLLVTNFYNFNVILNMHLV